MAPDERMIEKKPNSENNEPISRCEHEPSEAPGKVPVNVEYENNK